MTAWWSGRSGILILLLVYLFLGTRFTASVPPWEAPDEPWHLVYSEALASGRLPSPEATYEHHHPPLYYLWPALTLRAAGLDSVPRSVDNFRYPFAAAAYLHPVDEAAHAPMRLLRTLSGMLGALAVALTWASAELAARRHPSRESIAFMAALFVALLPQFGFIAHSISNDTLATVWGAWLLYWGLRWIRYGRDSGTATDPDVEHRGSRKLEREGPVVATALGLGAGLGLLTKLNLLALWPAIALAWALGALLYVRGARSLAGATDGRTRTAWSGAPLTIALAGLIIPILSLGLVYLATQFWPSIGTNLRSTLLDRGAAREDLSGAAYLFDQARRMLDSLWGRYGWFNLRPPLFQRQLMNVLALLALLGLPVAFRRASLAGRASIVYALSVCALALVAGLRNVMVDPQPQARLLFPALPALALLLGWGGYALVQALDRKTGSPSRLLPAAPVSVLGLALVMTSLYASQVLLPKAYAPSRISPPMLDTRMLPAAWKFAAQLDGDGARATQTFVANEDGLRGIEVPVIIASGDGKLTAQLHAGDQEAHSDSAALLATVEFPLSSLGRPEVESEVLGPLADTTWIRVPTDPIAGSAGQTYTLELQIVGAGRAWLWGARDRDDYALGRLIVDHEEETDLVFVTLR